MSDLIHPKIGIFYTLRETRAALELKNKYSKLGARVEMTVVSAEPEARRELCYFDYKDSRHREIAFIMAKGLEAYGAFKVICQELRKPEFDFTVCLVREIQFSTCPKCKCKVRVERLKRHLKQPHPETNQKKRRKKRKFTPLIKHTETIKPKRLVFAGTSPVNASVMGQPTTIGWDWTSSSFRVKKLRPRSGSRMCRICQTKPVMYNASECYLCNPK